MKRVNELLTRGWTALLGEFHLIQLKTLNNNQMKTNEFFKKTKIRFNLLPVLLLAMVIGFTSCNDDDDPMPEPEMEQTIVDVAAEAGSFNVLIQAAQKAGLADFLSTQQNITVFAPTDDAFWRRRFWRR